MLLILLLQILFCTAQLNLTASTGLYLDWLSQVSANGTMTFTETNAAQLWHLTRNIRDSCPDNRDSVPTGSYVFVLLSSSSVLPFPREVGFQTPASMSEDYNTAGHIGSQATLHFMVTPTRAGADSGILYDPSIRPTCHLEVQVDGVPRYSGTVGGVTQCPVDYYRSFSFTVTNSLTKITYRNLANGTDISPSTTTSTSNLGDQVVDGCIIGLVPVGQQTELPLNPVSQLSDLRTTYYRSNAVLQLSMQTTGEQTTALDTTGPQTTGQQTTALDTTGMQTTGFQTTEMQTTQADTTEVQTTEEQTNNSTEPYLIYAITGGIIGAAALAVLLLLLCYVCFVLFILTRMPKRHKPPTPSVPAVSIPTPSSEYSIPMMSKPNNDEYSTISLPAKPVDQKWEIDFEDLTLGEELGTGAYGVVNKGQWRGTHVAIKRMVSMNDVKDLHSFREEFTLMKNLRPHRNIVQVLGVCLDPLSIVTEFVAGGSLYSFLHSSLPLNGELLFKIIRGITSGMVHLEAEGVVHRDLAARNVLLTEDKEAKISDFGMSRSLGGQTAKKTQTDVGPIRWMAIESLTSQVYSSKSDVWAWAVTMYEILTRQDPYPGKEVTQVVIAVREGYRMDVPTIAGKELADLIKECWAERPQDRPTFAQIYKRLSQK